MAEAQSLDLAIGAIAAEMRSRIPTLEQLAAISEPEAMGPDVTMPAVWLSMLLIHIDYLDNRVRLRDLEAIGSLPRRDAPATPDAIAEYAGALAEHAAATCGDRIEGASALFQGAIASLMTILPPEGVLAAVEHLPEMFSLRSKLGIGVVRQ